MITLAVEGVYLLSLYNANDWTRRPVLLGVQILKAKSPFTKENGPCSDPFEDEFAYDELLINKEFSYRIDLKHLCGWYKKI